MVKKLTRLASLWAFTLLVAVFVVTGGPAPDASAAGCGAGFSDQGGGICSTVLVATGALQTRHVPAGITSMSMIVSGGQGGMSLDQGTGSGAPGGQGGRESATVPVTPGDTLSIVVGQGAGVADLINPPTRPYGGGGAPGGGYGGYGGGASFVFAPSSGLLIAAGGGGGSGYDYNPDASGQPIVQQAPGGAGAGASAAADGQSVAFCCDTTYPPPPHVPPGGGGGATPSAPGAGGVPVGANIGFGPVNGNSGQGPATAPGNLGTGGDSSGTAACYYGNWSGGGGGGYYGGGSGGSISCDLEGGGGGGGSGYVIPSATGAVSTVGAQAADGEITLTYTTVVGPVPPGAPTSPTAAAGKQRATVSWTAPTSNGGSTITSYTVTASPGGATCGWSSGPLSCVVSGLTAGAPYTFKVTATNSAGTGSPSVASNSVVPWSGSSFHAVVPFRALDSRTPVGGFGGPIGPGGSKSLPVAGVGTVPAGASAVVMNVTATDGTVASYVTAYPTGSAVPTAANLLFAAGQTVPNLVTVGLGAGGQVSFFNQLGSVHVIADVVGYFDDGNSAGDLFRGVTPGRVLDSRSPLGGWASTPLGPAETRAVTVLGVAPVPATATAVVMNVTVTGGTAASYLQALPTGSSPPVTANLLFGAGQTVPNLVVVGVGSGGQVSFFNQFGTVHVIADVVGYFDPTAGGSRFHPIDPARVLDDRYSIGLVGPWAPNQSRALAVTGSPSIPAGATGLVANTTVTGGTKASFLTVYPDGMPRPGTANLLFVGGQTVPNAVMVGIAANGKIDLYNQLGYVDIITDSMGYYATY